MRWLVGLASLGAIAAVGAGYRWIFEIDRSFGFGVFVGMVVMVLLYFIAEKTGIRDTRY